MSKYSYKICTFCVKKLQHWKRGTSLNVLQRSFISDISKVFLHPSWCFGFSIWELIELAATQYNCWSNQTSGIEVADLKAIRWIEENFLRPNFPNQSSHFSGKQWAVGSIWMRLYWDQALFEPFVITVYSHSHSNSVLTFPNKICM